jgi:hypothetical protein
MALKAQVLMSAGAVLVPIRGMVMVEALTPPQDEPAVPSQETAIEYVVGDPDGSEAGVAGVMVMRPVSPPLAWAGEATTKARSPSGKATAMAAARVPRIDCRAWDMLVHTAYLE